MTLQIQIKNTTSVIVWAYWRRIGDLHHLQILTLNADVSSLLAVQSQRANFTLLMKIVLLSPSSKMFDYMSRLILIMTEELSMLFWKKPDCWIYKFVYKCKTVFYYFVIHTPVSTYRCPQEGLQLLTNTLLNTYIYLHLLNFYILLINSKWGDLKCCCKWCNF